MNIIYLKRPSELLSRMGEKKIEENLCKEAWQIEITSEGILMRGNDLHAAQRHAKADETPGISWPKGER